MSDDSDTEEARAMERRVQFLDLWTFVSKSLCFSFTTMNLLESSKRSELVKEQVQILRNPLIRIDQLLISDDSPRKEVVRNLMAWFQDKHIPTAANDQLLSTML